MGQNRLRTDIVKAQVFWNRTVDAITTFYSGLFSLQVGGTLSGRRYPDVMLWLHKGALGNRARRFFAKRIGPAAQHPLRA